MPKKMEGIASGQGNEEGVPLFLLISPRREAKKNVLYAFCSVKIEEIIVAYLNLVHL